MKENDDVRIEPEKEEGGKIESEIADEEARAEGRLAKLRDELENCRKEKQEYLDGWQRAKADYVNALKRSENDIKAAKSIGVVKAVATLLPALDALTRAKEHGEVPPGFEAIAKQLEAAFSSLGLEAVGVPGEKFDPLLHEALGQETVDSTERDDTVTTVLEKGWKIGETLIRPAKVRVGHFTG